MILGDLQEGIVIDHIPVGKGMVLYHYLGCLLYTSPSPRD